MDGVHSNDRAPETPRRLPSGVQAQFYDVLAEKVPDRRFIFMNVGYVDEEEDFSWVREQERDHKYAANLIRHLVAGIDLSDATGLDVGCGRGGACSFLSRYTGVANLHGLDLCRGAVAFCRDRYRHDRKLTFTQGNAMALPFADNTFSYAFNLESSHCYPDVPRFLREVRRVLKPASLFTYADAVQGAAELSRRHDEIADAGYRVLKSEDLTPQVVRGLEHNKDHLRRFLRSMIAPGLQNRGVIENLIHLLTVRVPASFELGDATFYSWRLRTPSS